MEADVRLLVNNALKYNMDGSEICEDANRLLVSGNCLLTCFIYVFDTSCIHCIICAEEGTLLINLFYIYFL